MRISELSRSAGVPVPTIKYYLREGLLSPGESTGATQAQYGDHHLQRLRLIRALADVGALPLSAIRRLVNALDGDNTGVLELLGIACHGLGPSTLPSADDPDWPSVRENVDDLLTQLGWQVTPEAPARDQLGHALLAIKRLGLPDTPDRLLPVAEAAHTLAAKEIDWLAESSDRSEKVEAAVLGTVLYEPVLLALRRLAQEHEAAKHFSEEAPG